MITIQQENIIRELIGKFNPTMVGVFGSYARNEQTAESDIDLLVDFKSDVNLLDIIGLEQDLSELLKVKVDLVTRRSVDENLMPYIQRDLIVIES